MGRVGAHRRREETGDSGESHANSERKSQEESSELLDEEWSPSGEGTSAAASAMLLMGTGIGMGASSFGGGGDALLAPAPEVPAPLDEAAAPPGPCCQ